MMQDIRVGVVAGISLLLGCEAAAAAPPTLYDSCVAKLQTQKDDAYCGGFVKGFKLGYDTRLAAIPWSGTSNGFVVDAQAFGIGGDKPFVFQPGGADSAEALVIERDDGSPDELKIGKGEYSFDVGQFKTLPLSTWLADNPARVDAEQLKALQSAFDELGGDKPVIYEIPGPAQ